MKGQLALWVILLAAAAIASVLVYYFRAPLWAAVGVAVLFSVVAQGALSLIRHGFLQR